MAETWRTEADDEWLAGRRSNVMAWLRRRFRVLGGIGGAVSSAETGPYAGAPRNPRLRAGDDKGHTLVHHTTVQVVHAAEPWAPQSRMPAAAKARRAARKTVL